MVGRAVVLGVAPAIMLGGGLTPAATAQTPAATTQTVTSFESGGASVPLAPEDSALPDVGTTDASVEKIAVAAAPAAATEQVSDVTTARPDLTAEPGTTADGEVLLDTTDSAGRVAGEVVVPDGFQTVGASWSAAIDADVPELQVRAQAEDGTWGQWTHLEKSSDVPDGEQTEFLSAPVHVGEAVAVQVATVDETTVVPDGVELTLVASEQVRTAAATTSSGIAPSAVGSGPTIIRRAEWGAAPPRAIPECPPAGGKGTPGSTWGAADRLDGAVVHHTVNPNDYATVAQAMQLIRNDQAYHQDGHGWCDIGYNFLVDKWGNIYEGAQGSIDAPIIGAHAGGFNNRTVGVSMLGTYTNVAPSAAQKDAVAEISGYRLARYGVNPGTSATFTSAGLTSGGRFGAGERVVLPRVFGHRDTHKTECPGNLAYPTLSSIQDRAAVYARQYTVVAEVPEKYRNAVQAVYRDMLGRSATAAEIKTWAPRVAASGTGGLVDAMEKSNQYRSKRVVSAFRSTLGRTPSSTQVSKHVSLMKQGKLRVDGVEPYIMWKSSAYYQKAGGTKAAYVNALYRDSLNQRPTAHQRKVWVARLSTMGKKGVVQGIWNSKAALRLRVTAAYRHYLNVRPTTAQRDTWVTRLSGKQTEAALRRSLITSKGYLKYADSRF